MSPAVTSNSNNFSTAQAHAVEELCSYFQLSTQALKEFGADLSSEMTYGLNSKDANMAMLPSWIYKRPTGEETGEYLGLELNGKVLDQERERERIWCSNTFFFLLITSRYLCSHLSYSTTR
jgi:hexokinase